jgi:hypothetical protein
MRGCRGEVSGESATAHSELAALAVIEFATPLSLFVGVCLENHVFRIGITEIDVDKDWFRPGHVVPTGSDWAITCSM